MRYMYIAGVAQKNIYLRKLILARTEEDEFYCCYYRLLR